MIDRRAFLGAVAALAAGESRLTGVLDSDDTRVMIDSLGRLGIRVDVGDAGRTLVLDGALVFQLALPTDPLTWLAFLCSVFLGILVSFAIRYLVTLCSFWLMDMRGLMSLSNMTAMFMSGMVLPLTVFPSGLAEVAQALPADGRAVGHPDAIAVGIPQVGRLGQHVVRWCVGEPEGDEAPDDPAETLRAQQFVPQSDLDLARTNHKDASAQVEVTRAQIDQAAAALSLAELDLGYTKIYSPEDGIVISRKVDVGQTVVASLQAPMIFVIAKDLTKMQAFANVSESDIGGVAEGKAAEFTVDAFPDEPFHGIVSQVRNSPVSIQNVVTYDVIVDVDNSALKLKPGMTANVSIVTATKPDVLRVPNTALRFKPPGVPTEKKKSAVWRLDDAGRPRAVPLVPGAVGASYTEVKEGELREGDAVIIGLESTEAGQKELPPGFGMGPQLR